jgi:hypothetical protein
MSSRKSFPKLAPTYRTHAHYLLNDSPPWYQLPPPTWNLDTDDTALPAPSSSNQKPRQRSKRKAKPLEHKYTHEAFCNLPNCTYHR